MKLGLHVHHETLLELLTEPIENRVKYIKENKPKEEIELRLRLLRELTEEEVNQLPKGFNQALKEYNLAGEEYNLARLLIRAWEKYIQAVVERDLTWEKYKQDLEKYKPELEAWHKKVCVPDCPWNGKTIFPKEGDNGDASK